MAYQLQLSDLPAEQNNTGGYQLSLNDLPAENTPVVNQSSPIDRFLPKPQPWAQNLDQGIQNFGAGALNSLNNLGESVYQQGVKPIDYALGTNLANQSKAESNDINQAYKQKYGNSMGATVGNIAGSIAPFALAPEAIGLDLMKAPEAIMNLAPNYPRLAGLVGTGVTNAAYNAGANTITGNNPLTGGAVGFAAGMAGRGINAGINALRPSQLLAGSASPLELMQNLTATQGTHTPLGDITSSPMAKRLFDNILTKIPGSGANAKLQQTAGQIVGQGNDIMGQLLGNNVPGDVGATLQRTLKDRLNSLQQMKRDNYALPNTIADQIGLTVGRNNFSQTAQNTLDEINQSPELAREIDPGILKDLNNYADPNAANTLKLSNIFKSKIGDKASDYFTNNQNYEYGIYKNLKDSLQQDIDNSITNSGSSKLQDAHAQANQFYKDNIAPFENPAIVKFTKQGGDADTLLSAFIKPGTINDRGNLVNTLVSKLPSNQQTLPAYGWFSKAIDPNGDVDPLKLSRIYNNLGVKQKAALIPDVNVRNQMDNYTNLVGKNNKALNLMQNPATGQQTMDLLPVLFAHALGASSGSVAGYHEGGMPGAILGGIAGLGASAAMARPVTAMLTSPAVREKLVQKMITGQPYAPVGNKMLGGMAGLTYQNQK